jgi:hypothetical protein
MYKKGFLGEVVSKLRSSIIIEMRNKRYLGQWNEAALSKSLKIGEHTTFS